MKIVNDFLRRPDASFALAFILSVLRRRQQRPHEAMLTTLEIGAAVGAARAFAIRMRNRPSD